MLFFVLLITIACAIVFLSQVPTLRNKPAWLHCVLGDVYKAQGKPRLAREHYQYAIAASPEDPINHAHLAKLHLERAEYDQGRECFGRALELWPSNPAYYLGRAKCCIGACLDEAALGDLEQAIKMDLAGDRGTWGKEAKQLREDLHQKSTIAS